MKKITKMAAHSKSINQVLASLRMERLVPSDDVVSGLRACLAGQRTTNEVLREVMRRHVTLRRV